MDGTARMMEDLLKLYADLVPIKHLIPHVIAGNHNFTFPGILP